MRRFHDFLDASTVDKLIGVTGGILGASGDILHASAGGILDAIFINILVVQFNFIQPVQFKLNFIQYSNDIMYW